MSIISRLFGKKKKEDKIEADKPSNGAPDVISTTNNIKIGYSGAFITVEIKNDCTIQEYYDEMERYLKEGIPGIEDSTLKILDRLPLQMLILRDRDELVSAYYTVINAQTAYLMLGNEYKYIIALNSENIQISETRIDVGEIVDRRIRICIPDKRCMVSEMVHDSNRSTKSVKSYLSWRVDNSSYPWYMNEEEASTVVGDVLENIGKDEAIKELVDLEYVKSFWNAIEVADRTENKDINEHVVQEDGDLEP